jgi:hypothetical protein
MPYTLSPLWLYFLTVVAFGRLIIIISILTMALMQP